MRLDKTRQMICMKHNSEILTDLKLKCEFNIQCEGFSFFLTLGKWQLNTSRTSQRTGFLRGK